MGFWSDFAGKPGEGTQQSMGAEQNLANMMQSDFQQQYQNQQGVLSSLRSSFAPTLAAGPSQMGYSPQLTAALNTQAINATGAASRNAQQFAATNSPAFQGNTGLESGVQQQIRGSIASAQAQNLANEQIGVTEASAKQGNENYWKAASGMSALGSQYDPSNMGKLAQGANETVYGQQHSQDLTRQKFASGIVNMGVGIGMDALTGGIAGGGMGALKGVLSGVQKFGPGGSGSGGGSDGGDGGPDVNTPTWDPSTDSEVYPSR